MKEKNRIYYLDILRIIAIFGVIVLHVSGSKWDSETGTSWQVLNIYDGLVRFCVPIFFMISGCLILNPAKPLPIKKLYSKNVLRIVIAFVFWSLCFALFFSLTNRIGNFMYGFLFGNPQIWFIYAIIGLYIATPILRRITEDKHLIKYFLIVSSIIGVLIPTLQEISILEKSTVFTSWMNLQLFSGYTFYFLVGYFLSSIITTKHMRVFIYILGIVGGVVTILGTSLLFAYTGARNEFLFNYLTPNVALQSMAVFVFFKQCFSVKSFSQKTGKIIVKISELTFGVYFVHVYWMMLFSYIGINAVSINSILSVPIASILIFICSLAVVFAISKLPFINKYII